MEPAGITDSRTGLPIRVSITTRKKYRQYWSGQQLPGRGDAGYSRMDWSSMRNKDLNQIIASDFVASKDNVVHMFKSNKTPEDSPEWIEIRLAQGGGASKLPFNLFLAVIRGQSIDIITVTTGYKKPRKPRLSPTN
jgi:hypothetical protein